MAACLNPLVSGVRGLRRRWWLAGLSVPAVLLVGGWWLTEPLADPGSSAPPPPPAPVVAPAAAVDPEDAPPVWPAGRLEGQPAKLLVLRALLSAADRLGRVPTYTATFRKQERIGGTLGPVQTLAMKVRQKPFAVYFKFLAPEQGKEVVYAAGHHDNKLIAHTGGFAGFLLPRLAVAPDHPIALADARHPVTEAGLANLTERLIPYRRRDLDDPLALTVLDRTTDADGLARLRSVHTPPMPGPDHPFARIEVLYDPATFVPVDIRNFDWPAPDHTGDLLLAEHYHYTDLDLDASLSALDFDPANPAYAFHRY